MSYGKHQTFFLRSNWIYKGISSFDDPKYTKDFLVQVKKYYKVMGLGSSMYKSLRYWLEAANIIEYAEGNHHLTYFGEYLKSFDLNADMIFSKLILHYFLVSDIHINTTEQSHSFYWFFNVNTDRVFDKQYLISEIEKWDKEAKSSKNKVNFTSVNTIKSDVDVLINTYTKLMPSHPEDKNYSPLAELGLLKEEGKNIFKLPLSSAKYSLDAFMYLILLWKENGEDLLVDSLVETPSSIGKAFNLGRSDILELLETMIQKKYPIEISRTNNLNYLKITTEKSAKDFMLSRTEGRYES